MRFRTVALSVAVAATLVAAPVASAWAASKAHSRPGVAQAAEAKEKEKAKAKGKGKAQGKEKAKPKAKAQRPFVAGGTVTAVDATGSTLTFTVKGGPDKALRGTDLTVTVAATAKVTRDAVVTLADVLPGDHVVVKAANRTALVTRVAASAPEPSTTGAG